MLKSISITIIAIGVFIMPAAAQDRFSGWYAAGCPNRHVCNLHIDPAGPNRWSVDLEIFTKTGASPICTRSFAVQVGGPEGVFVPGIASGVIDGRLTGILDRGTHLEVRSSSGCGGIGMAGDYHQVGD